MLPTANILWLSLSVPVQLSDLIWISDSTSHTAGWGKTGTVGKATSFNWPCSGVLRWLQQTRIPSEVRKEKTNQNVEVTGSFPSKASDFLSFLFLLTVLENSCMKLDVNVLHSVFNSCDFLIYCFIVTLKYAESHEQELIERVKQ